MDCRATTRTELFVEMSLRLRRREIIDRTKVVPGTYREIVLDSTICDLGA